MDTRTTDKPLRVGVFDTVTDADRAVRQLLEAGFTKEQIGVMAADKYKRDFFKDLPEPAPAGNKPATAIAAGGAIGATIGGIVLAATTIATGGMALLAAGVLVGGGAVAGAFTGAMSSFGFENDKADYYSQALQEGRILVVADVRGEGNADKLAMAARILEHAGADRVGKVSD
jgi:hypothetical protein